MTTSRAIPPLNIATATFESPGLDDSLREHYRSELALLAWQDMENIETDAVRWALPSEGPIRLQLLGPDAKTLRTRLQALADRFDKCIGDLRSQPLGGIDRLPPSAQKALLELRGVLEATPRRAAPNGLDPDGSAITERDRNQSGLALRRRAFEAIHAKVDELQARLDILEPLPLPERGWIDPELEIRTREADRDLQEDVAAVHVHLADIRRQLLDIWQSSASVLDDLTSCVGKLRRVPAGDAAQAADRAVRELADNAVEDISAYQSRLTTYMADWTRTFVKLQHLKIDPYSTDVIEAHETIDHLWGDFTYDAEGLLEKLEGHCRTLTDACANSAKHFRFQADFVTAVSDTIAAHSRLGRIARNVKTAENFELDAAVRSALGLKRRVEWRLGSIRKRLEKEALQEARQQRMEAIATLKKDLRELRTSEAHALNEIFTLQDVFWKTIADADSTIMAQASFDERRRWEDRLFAIFEEEMLSGVEASEDSAPPLSLRTLEVATDRTREQIRAGAGTLSGLCCLVFLGSLFRRRR